MAIVTIFAVVSWWLAPEDAWLSKKHITHILDSADTDTNAGASESVDTPPPPGKFVDSPVITDK